MAHAYSRPVERNSPDLIRGHDGGGVGSESPSGFFRIFRRQRSVPFGNLYGVSVVRKNYLRVLKLIF
jgi:hypothetical protein